MTIVSIFWDAAFHHVEHGLTDSSIYHLRHGCEHVQPLLVLYIMLAVRSSAHVGCLTEVMRYVVQAADKTLM